MFEDIYGLSCIENQVLAILKERNQKIALTYSDSAMPVHEIFKIIVRHGVRQENFSHLRRVHDLLKELGVIVFSGLYIYQPFFRDFRDITCVKPSSSFRS